MVYSANMTCALGTGATFAAILYFAEGFPIDARLGKYALYAAGSYYIAEYLISMASSTSS
jgi:hypothetical protein